MSIDPHDLKRAIQAAIPLDLPEGFHQLHTAGINRHGQIVVKTFVFETGEAPLPANGGNWQWDWKTRPVNSWGVVDYEYTDEDGETQINDMERAWDGG